MNATNNSECVAIDVNGNIDTVGALTLGTVLAVAEGCTGVGTSTGSGANALATSPTITTSLIMADSANIVINTGTGTKIGTGVTQKIGFWNVAPVVQQAHIADATDAADVILRLNDLLAQMATLGLQAAS